MSLELKRGFNHVREQIQSKSRYLRDCNNCRFFYQAPFDEEELCQNEQVLAFDICTDNQRIYCCYWLPNGEKEKKKKEPEKSKHSWYDKERRK